MTNKDKALEIIDRLKFNGYVNNRERGILRRALLEERPKGYWTWNEWQIFCSECLEVCYDGVPKDRVYYPLYDFCPYCGADMRREAENEI